MTILRARRRPYHRPVTFALPRVLIVEDDSALRRFLCHALTRQGMTVEVAADGASARKRLHDGSEWDCVLIDGLLPDELGTDLALDLVDDAATAGLPICFVTGTLHGGETAAESGVGWLPKPVRPAEIRETVLRLMEWARRGGSPAADRRLVLRRLEDRLTFSGAA